jgi:hypothetical protein
MDPPALLHNMSVYPKVVIAHEAPRPRGRAIAFRLPTGNLSFRPVPLLSRLDGKRWRRGPDEAERELRRRLDEHAMNLPFPAAALVTDTSADAEGGPADLLTVCTVLAKSSGRVYLRDKEPNLANIRKGRLVTLRIPGQEGQNA